MSLSHDPRAALGAETPVAQASTSTIQAFSYLPPAWADRVVFYDSFSRPSGEPEINRIAAKLALIPDAKHRTSGFVGPGCLTPLSADGKRAFEIASPALSVHRPVTVMCWFAVQQSMQETTGFGLLSLRGNGPYLTHFVAGKGPWCALREPTFIYQVVNFPGIPLYHNSRGGRAWFEPGEWHHVALTVANASEVRVYRDGKLCETMLPKGRLFREGEIHTAVFGSQGHPLAIDEVLVLDRTLTPSELHDYVVATGALRSRAFPFASE